MTGPIPQPMDVRVCLDVRIGRCHRIIRRCLILYFPVDVFTETIGLMTAEQRSEMKVIIPEYIEKKQALDLSRVAMNDKKNEIQYLCAKILELAAGISSDQYDMILRKSNEIIEIAKAKHILVEEEAHLQRVFEDNSSEFNEVSSKLRSLLSLSKFLTKCRCVQFLIHIYV